MNWRLLIMRSKILAIAVFILCSLAFVGKAGAAHYRYEVIWRVSPCPFGFLCKFYSQSEPNYGQALKLERKLEAEGYLVTIQQIP